MRNTCQTGLFPPTPPSRIENSSASTISQNPSPYPNPVLLPPHTQPLAPLLGRQPSRCLPLAAIGLDEAGDANAAGSGGCGPRRSGGRSETKRAGGRLGRGWRIGWWARPGCAAVCTECNLLLASNVFLNVNIPEKLEITKFTDLCLFVYGRSA